MFLVAIVTELIAQALLPRDIPALLPGGPLLRTS